jgi:hypothetical protein
MDVKDAALSQGVGGMWWAQFVSASDSSRDPRLHRHREVQERGVVHRRLEAALPGVTA